MQEPVHIFLADDDADDRGLFYEAIRIAAPKAKMSVAQNGLELLDVLLQTDTKLPRVVFLDLNMPIRNGHESLADIRSNEQLKNIPVFIYSTSENPDDIEKSFKGGADFYINKPMSFSDLQQIIKAILSLNRQIHMPPVRESFVLKAAEAE